MSAAAARQHVISHMLLDQRLRFGQDNGMLTHRGVHVAEVLVPLSLALPHLHCVPRFSGQVASASSTSWQCLKTAAASCHFWAGSLLCQQQAAHRTAALKLSRLSVPDRPVCQQAPTIADRAETQRCRRHQPSERQAFAKGRTPPAAAADTPSRSLVVARPQVCDHVLQHKVCVVGDADRTLRQACGPQGGQEGVDQVQEGECLTVVLLQVKSEIRDQLEGESCWGAVEPAVRKQHGSQC